MKEQEKNKTIIMVGIETSCDETSVAVLKYIDGNTKVLSNVVSSQIDIHKEYGGVVPEIASRQHLENISDVFNLALQKANIKTGDITAITVTAGPGLIGALLVGVSFAKGLAYSMKIPVIPLHHIKGHIAANYITHPELKPPFLALVVSGGHSHCILQTSLVNFKILAKTRDDACGEAFDKVARVLGLGYPGGPAISKLAMLGKNTYHLPTTKFEDNLDFSFSGVKTAVLNIANKEGENLNINDMCASFEDNVTQVLVEHAIKLAKQEKLDKIVLAGGVSANHLLREKLVAMCDKNQIKAYLPDLQYTTDNAAMIAMAGICEYIFNKEKYLTQALSLNAKASLSIEE